MNYTDFLDGLQLRHFDTSEITAYANRTRNGVRNSLPDLNLWKNIVPTLWVLDLFRHEIGKPITLTSIYRSPEYNRAVGGASASYHKKNQAIDFKVSGLAPRDAFGALSSFRSAGIFSGGLGLYSTFVHIDTRGHNATWGN